jgi:hypothetical protein
MQESSTLFCAIRKEWVAALPEEKVRQRILFHMIDQKGFPASLVSVEQSLKHLPHLQAMDRRSVPNRRADIVCFSKGVRADLRPLLLIECKSIKLTPSIMSQVVGYNHFVGSRFIAIGNHEEIRTGWYNHEKKDYEFINFLPDYSDLIKVI